MKHISIIIPAYNIEKYVRKCVESCESQDLAKEEYEVIIVDDGSTDSTASIVRELQSSYDNIKYIYQENAKQGAARNRGLREATGEYIWFVDGDDWIAENCLSRIVKRLKSDNLRGVLVGHAKQYQDHLKIWDNFDETIIQSGKEILSNGCIYISPTYAIWEHEYLIKIGFNFVEKVYHEDLGSFPRLFFEADRIGYINEKCYFILSSANSTTRRVNPQKAFDLIAIANRNNEFRLHANDSKIDLVFNNLISLTVNSSLMHSYNMDVEMQNNLNTLLYENRHLLDCLIKSSKIKYKIEGLLFRLFPKRYIQTYQFMQRLNPHPGDNMMETGF